MKCLIVGVAMTGREKERVRWLLGLPWISALYDTQAERSIAFLFVAALVVG